MDMWVARYRVDLHTGSVSQLSTGPRVFPVGSADALRIEVDVRENGSPASLSGWTISADAVRQDGYDAGPIPGTVDGSVAGVVLDAGCFSLRGRLQVTVWAARGAGVNVPLLRIAPEVVQDGNGLYLDTSNMLPSVPELLAEIDNMRAATAAANEAADRANEAVIAAAALGDLLFSINPSDNGLDITYVPSLTE